ncbi:hypothetical protein M3Y96_01179700 [Aphelenchoides besseyi]|nr:hypothetical protein M3Y96_01179700 [Aphelenchoides besseyi]
MDTRSKIIFLKEVRARKHDLFSKGDSRFKDEAWQDIYTKCLAKGCIGLRNSEYLRRTTYQNIQRRAKEKYEKGLKDGMETINLTEVDELLLEIIGRDKFKATSDNGDVFTNPDFHALLGLLGQTANTDISSTNNLDFSARDCTPLSDLAENGTNQSIQQDLNGISSISTNDASPEDEQSDSDVGTPTIRQSTTISNASNNFPAALWTSLIQQNNSHSTNKPNGDIKPISELNIRKRPKLSPQNSDGSDVDEAELKRQKLRAEIRLLEIQTEVQERESQLKKLQIISLRRDLGLCNSD